MAGRFSVEAIFKAVDRMTAPVSRMSRNIGKFASSAKRDLEQLSSISGSVFSGLKYAAAGAVVAFGLVSAALMEVSDRADDLLMRSQRLNFNIESLQEWQYVAEQTGISVGEFDTALDKFSKTLGAAKLGTGTLAATLKKTNPQLLRQLKATKDTGQAFDLYLEFLRKTEDPLKRNAYAAAAFGRSGDKLNNIVTETTEAVSGLRAEARANGIMTLQMAKDAEAFGDSVNSLKRSITGVMASALVPLMPILSELIKRARVWIIANREVISEKLMSSVTWIINNFGEIVTWLKRIGVAMVVFVTFTAILQTFVGVLTLINLLVAANPLTWMILGFVALTAAVAAAIVFFDDFADTFARLGPIAQILLSPVMGLIVALKLLWEIGSAVVSGLLGDWQPMREFWDGLLGTIGNVLKMIGRAVGLVDDVNPIRVQTDEGGTNAAAVAANALPVTNTAGAQMVSPQERVARTIDETRTTSAAELLIRDETGRGVLKQPKNNPTLIDLVQSGAF